MANRLKRELLKRHIIWETDDVKAMLYGAEYDHEQRLVGIEGNYIICVWYSAVTDPELRLYDRHTMERIGGQYMRPETTFDGDRTWGSWMEQDIFW